MFCVDVVETDLYLVEEGILHLCMSKKDLCLTVFFFNLSCGAKDKCVQDFIISCIIYLVLFVLINIFQR